MELVHLPLAELSKSCWINTAYRLWWVSPLHPTFPIVFPWGSKPRWGWSTLNPWGATSEGCASPSHLLLLYAKPLMLPLGVSLASSFSSWDWFGEIIAVPRLPATSCQRQLIFKGQSLSRFSFLFASSVVCPALGLSSLMQGEVLHAHT